MARPGSGARATSLPAAGPGGPPPARRRAARRAALSAFGLVLSLAATGCGASQEERTTLRGKAGRESGAMLPFEDASAAHALEARLASRVGVGPGVLTAELREDRTAVLHGTVPHLLMRIRAEEVAAHTRGVRGYESRIAVAGASRSDVALQRDVRRALDTAADLDATHVRAHVLGGRVFLAGRVPSVPAAETAQYVASAVRGVRSVTSTLDVVPRERLDDTTLRASIRERLDRDARVDARALSVTVEGGHARVRGAVNSEAERRTVRDLAAVRGVRAVDVSRLVVRAEPAPWATAPIDDPARALRERLARDPRIDGEDVRVSVVRGIATLEGSVTSLAAERVALAMAEHTAGVERVRSHLVVVPSPLVDDEALAERVGDVLGMSPYVDRTSIDIDAEEGVVRLEGRVPTLLARREAIRAASTVSGVRRIDARLRVEAPADEAARTLALEQELRDCPHLERASVEVAFADGVATLRGEVSDQRARYEAEREALEMGAERVVNELRVRAP